MANNAAALSGVQRCWRSAIAGDAWPNVRNWRIVLKKSALGRRPNFYASWVRVPHEDAGDHVAWHSLDVGRSKSNCEAIDSRF